MCAPLKLSETSCSMAFRSQAALCYPLTASRVVLWGGGVGGMVSFCRIVRVEVETELPGMPDPGAGWRVHRTRACRGVYIL